MSGDTDRWRRLDALLEQALDLPPASREAFLAEATDDPGLRREVLELLLLEPDVGRFLEIDGPAIPSGLLHEVAAGLGTGFAEGAMVGRYRILRELGRGGMSRVFLAERADGEFEQMVALKVLRSELRTDDLAPRIRTERQILASLDHPGIAKVFDGGVTDDGRPYLVIEVVEGERIDRYADAHALSVADRVALFREVCAAVQYAHQNLVVHRDLKPSNIFVNATGTVKLLDFGIAKLLGTSPDPDSTVGPQTRWMTPEYAAPEQILGRPVTTAADVYALGVVLYELLSGHKPFGHGTMSGFELEKSILEDAPPRPSAASGRSRERRTRARAWTVTPEELASARSSEPARLRKTLDGDLDAIVLKALRKEPEHRYESAGALSEDLLRYLEGFPVEAHEGAGAYRAGKFVRRHRWPVLAATAVAVMLLAGSAALSLQQAETARERDRANRAAALAEEEATNAQLITDFLADVFRGRDPNQAPGDTVTAGELLSWGLERVETEFTDRPGIQSDLYRVMAGAHWNLGLSDESIALHDRSVAVAREAFGPRDIRVAEAMASLADVRASVRDFESAVEAWREVLEIRRAGLPSEDPLVAEALFGLASGLRDLGRADTAEVLMGEGLEIRRLSNGEDSREYAMGLLSLAYVKRAQQKLDEAEALYREGIPRYRAIAGSEDANLPIYLNNLAFLLRVKGDFEGAEPIYRDALGVLTDLYGRSHPNTLLLASNLAGTLHELGRTAEVLEILGENLRVLEEQWPEGHVRVATSLQALGLATLRGGDPGGAMGHLRRAVEMNAGLGDQGWFDITTVSGGALAAAYLVTDREDEGVPLLERVYERVRELAEGNGGTIPFTRVGSHAGLILAMEETGLREQAARFDSLLPSGWR